MTRKNLNTFASVFGLAFLVTVAMQLFTLAMVTIGHDLAYDLHSAIFQLTPELFDSAIYYLLGLMKILGLTLFLCPWIALKLVARRLPE